jgi:hypothetical protein
MHGAQKNATVTLTVSISSRFVTEGDVSPCYRQFWSLQWLKQSPSKPLHLVSPTAVIVFVSVSTIMLHWYVAVALRSAYADLTLHITSSQRPAVPVNATHLTNCVIICSSAIQPLCLQQRQPSAGEAPPPQAPVTCTAQHSTPVQQHSMPHNSACAAAACCTYPSSAQPALMYPAWQLHL